MFTFTRFEKNAGNEKLFGYLTMISELFVSSNNIKEFAGSNQFCKLRKVLPSI